MQPTVVSAKKRIVYFDYLRVAATIAVVLAHVASFYWESFGGRSITWNVLNFYITIIRWTVPIFVMLSGSLFLSKDLDIKRLYKKNVLRMIVVYLAWGAFYALVFPLYNWIFHQEPLPSLGNVILDTLSGSYHMWFIPMIIGLYICAPVLRKIVLDRKIAKYFLTLTFVFTFAIPQAIALCRDFAHGWLLELAEQLDVLVNYDMKLFFVLGYTAYFVLGYLLDTTELSKKQRTRIYILGVVGFVTSIGLNVAVSWIHDTPCGTYFEAFCVNILFMAIAVHTWFKYRDYPNEKLNRIVYALSKYSFGVYLVHAFSLDVLDILGITAMTWNPVIGVPITTLAATVLSFSISWVIHKIPVLNKWIV